MKYRMKSDDLNDLEMAHVDVPTLEYPCAGFIQMLLYNLDLRVDNEVSLPAFAEFVCTELQISKSAYWGYDKELYEKLIAFSEAYLLLHSDQLCEPNVSKINESITLLKFLSESRSNLEAIPNGYTDFDQRFSCYSEKIKRRVEDKFKGSMVTCPACENEFSQVDFNVVRTLHAVKCPKCQISFAP